MNFLFIKRFVLSFFLIFSVSLSAQKKIHVLKILDTDMTSNDGSYPSELRNGAENTRIQIEHEAMFLMRYLNLTEEDVILYEVSGKEKNGKNNFTKIGLDSTIESLLNNCKTGDYVIVANYTHGLKSDRNNTDAPQISLGPDYAKEYYYFDDILLKIERAKPAFIFSLVTACQKSIHDATLTDNPLRPRYVPSHQSNIGSRVASNENREESTYQYQRLFANPSFQDYATISVELYSCSHNQYSYVNSDGGTFAYEFFKIFKQKLSKGGRTEISWKNIASEVRNNVEEITANNEKGIQTPVGMMRYISTDGKIKKEYLDEKIRKEVIPLEKQDVYRDYLEHTKLNKNPPLRLAFRFVVLASSYLAEGYPELSIQTLDIAIPIIEKQMFKDIKNKVVIPKNKITLAGDVVYYLGKAYEFKGRSINTDTDAGVQEAKKCFQIAKQLYKSIDAKSSDELMKKRIEELERFKVIRA